MSKDGTRIGSLQREVELRNRIAKLESENAELRASLKECVEYVERYEDSGPLGEGWQSKRLVNVCQHARALLAKVNA